MDVDILRRHPTQEPGPTVVLATLELESRPESGKAARRFTREALSAFGVGRDRLDDLLIAVSEAFTNAVEAQAERGVTSSLTVRCSAAVDEVAIEVQDHAGGGVDLTDWRPRPLLEDRDLSRERGWGIQLMRLLVDHASFDRTPDGTLVRLAIRR